jgi:large subunit ribosomal protein L18
MDRKIHNPKEKKRTKRAASIRKKLEGSAERPRLAVFRSAKHIYAQLVDDIHGVTITSASTQTPDLRDALKGQKKTAKAVAVGKKIAELAKAKGVSAVVFDRAGYPYHGRVAALANGAREGGLQF